MRGAQGHTCWDEGFGIDGNFWPNLDVRHPRLLLSSTPSAGGRPKSWSGLLALSHAPLWVEELAKLWYLFWPSGAGTDLPQRATDRLVMEEASEFSGLPLRRLLQLWSTSFQPSPPINALCWHHPSLCFFGNRQFWCLHGLILEQML